MSRALIFALNLAMAMATVYEWKGIFYTPEDTYMWGAEKVGGDYADPAMVLVLIPTSAATADALKDASGKGLAAMSMACEEVKSGGTVTPAADKCYKLVFDPNKAGSKYKVDASGTTAIAFFAEHLPTEFEATEHYFKDTTGVDIEPVAQEPEPGEDGHSHGHGGPDAFEGMCVCQAKKKGWKLDCTAGVKISEAVAALDAKKDLCMNKDPPEDCVVNYHVMQAHHDHCLHDDLPTGIEKKLHDYEHYYTDCFVKRQYNPALGACPEVNCDDATAMTKAIATLQAGCTSTQACADSTCAAAIKLVLMVHDTCPEDKLPNNLEVALHDHEEPCEAQLCNSAGGAFDPYAESCGEAAAAESSPSTASTASGLASQKAFLVTTLALPLAVCLLHFRHAK